MVGWGQEKEGAMLFWWCEECHKRVWGRPIYLFWNTAKKKSVHFCRSICRERWLKRVFPELPKAHRQSS